MIKAEVFILLIFIALSAGLRYSSVEKTYEKGITAYSDERWSECIAQLEESLHLYKLYKTIDSNCRSRCNTQQYQSVVENGLEDLRIFEKFFIARDCINKCIESDFQLHHVNRDVDDTIIFYMETRKPYEYLHICYYQMNMMPKATAAAYTYLVAHPDSQDMKENIQYYMRQPGVDANDVVDLQSDDYVVMLQLGIKAYESKKWGEAIASMEEVITDYIAWENGCRATCQRQPDQLSTPEFIETVSNNFASLLHCHQQCQDRLKQLRYESGIDFLADVLNYLQISYYHLERYKDAAKAAESYLALLPEDQEMLENKKLYSTIVDKEAFEERSDIIYYLKRDNNEKKLLNIFHHGQNDISNNII